MAMAVLHPRPRKLKVSNNSPLFVCVIAMVISVKQLSDWVRIFFVVDKSNAEGEKATPAHPMPYNPFMQTGALVMCSLLGRGHFSKRQRLFTDSASRFSHMMKGIQSMAGESTIGFSKPTFLSLKQRGKKVCVYICV